MQYAKANSHSQIPSRTNLDGHVSEEIADTLAIVCPANGLGNGAADVDDLDLGAALLLVTERDGVGDDDLGQAALVDSVDGTAAQNTVCLKS